MDKVQRIKALIESMNDTLDDDEMTIVDVAALYPDLPRRTLSDRLSKLVAAGKLAVRKNAQGHNIYKVLP